MFGEKHNKTQSNIWSQNQVEIESKSSLCRNQERSKKCMYLSPRCMPWGRQHKKIVASSHTAQASGLLAVKRGQPLLENERHAALVAADHRPDPLAGRQAPGREVAVGAAAASGQKKTPPGTPWRGRRTPARMDIDVGFRGVLINLGRLTPRYPRSN